MSPRARATRSQARILHLKQSTSNGPPQQPEGDHASKHRASHAKAAHKAAPHNPLLSGSHGHTRGRRAVGPVTASDCPQPEAHPCATRCAPGVRAPPGPAGHAPPTPDRSPIGASAPSAPAYVGAQWHTSPLIRKSPQKWQTPRHTRCPPPPPPPRSLRLLPKEPCTSPNAHLERCARQRHRPPPRHPRRPHQLRLCTRTWRRRMRAKQPLRVPRARETLRSRRRAGPRRARSLTAQSGSAKCPPAARLAERSVVARAAASRSSWRRSLAACRLAQADFSLGAISLCYCGLRSLKPGAGRRAMVRSPRLVPPTQCCQQCPMHSALLDACVWGVCS